MAQTILRDRLINVNEFESSPYQHTWDLFHLPISGTMLISFLGTMKLKLAGRGGPSSSGEAPETTAKQNLQLQSVL